MTINLMTNHTELMRAYWRNSKKPRRIFALVSVGGEQPVGYVKGWSVNLGAMKKQLEAEWCPEHWVIRTIHPECE